MENNLINNFNRQSEEEFNIRDFLFLCLAKWRWFVLSLFICLSLAIYKVSTTHPTYSRYTDILIKTGEQGNMGEQMEKFAAMSAFRGNTTVYNEIYNQLFFFPNKHTKHLELFCRYHQLQVP